jgi:hypothetical protein
MKWLAYHDHSSNHVPEPATEIVTVPARGLRCIDKDVLIHHIESSVWVVSGKIALAKQFCQPYQRVIIVIADIAQHCRGVDEEMACACCKSGDGVSRRPAITAQVMNGRELSKAILQVMMYITGDNVVLDIMKLECVRADQVKHTPNARLETTSNEELHWQLAERGSHQRDERPTRHVLHFLALVQSVDDDDRTGLGANRKTPKQVSKVSVSEAARSGVQALLDGGMGAKYSAAVEPRMERPVALCTVARNAKLSRLGFEA